MNDLIHLKFFSVSGSQVAPRLQLNVQVKKEPMPRSKCKKGELCSNVYLKKNKQTEHAYIQARASLNLHKH